MINRRFQPKPKELVSFRDGSRSQYKYKTQRMFSCESFSKENFILMDQQSKRHTNQEKLGEIALQRRRFAQPLYNKVFAHSQYSHHSPIMSDRKYRLYNLRSSIYSLYKVIYRSRYMLNESSVLNSSKNTFSSSKQKIKSDSLDIKFNYSTKKMNMTKLYDVKANKMNQSLYTAYMLSIDDTNQSYRENLLLYSARKNLSFRQKNESSKFKFKDVENMTYIKTNAQLNNTLEKLLNQSFYSTINGKTISLSFDSPSSTFTGETPKWFKSNNLKKPYNFKGKNNIIHIYNDPFSENSIDTSKFSDQYKIFQDENYNYGKIFKKKVKYSNNDLPFFHDPNTHEKSFDEDKYNEMDTKLNIFIEDKDNKSYRSGEQSDDVIGDYYHSGVKKIYNFLTNNRQSYHSEMRLQNSYLREITDRRHVNALKYKTDKSKKIIMRTPKAYKNYYQNSATRKKSNNKSWIPKNFNEFEDKVLYGKIHQNFFREYSNKGKFSPRFVPCGKYNKNEVIKVEKKVKTPNTYDKYMKQKFIQDVWRYPFVYRYLKQSDILMIYEKLKRSKVPEQKWILFVVDEVHKKMKQRPY